MNDDPSSRLARSWDRNAANWTRAVREKTIASRRAGTDKAIVDAIVRRAPKRLLDVGCGEGWLIRRVSQRIVCDCVGIDGSAELVAAAQEQDPSGTYRAMRYEELPMTSGTLGGAFDVVVFNFALFDETAPAVLSALVPLLSATGVIIIQTLHPCFAVANAPYHNGWQSEEFAAMEGKDWTPMPWFFRTLSSWHGVVRAAGLVVDDMAEPQDAATHRPLSLLLTCVPERW